MSERELPAELAALDEQMRAADDAKFEVVEEAAPERPEPEGVEASDDAAEAGQAVERAEKPKMVPHGAFHEARERRKEAEAALAQERAAKAELERRLAEIEAKINPPAKEPEWVDPVTDPDGYRKWDEHRAGKITAMEREAREKAERDEMTNRLAREEQTFAAETPDYFDAVNYVMEARSRELALLTDDQAAIKNAVAQEAQALVRTALSAGRSPARVIYDIAKTRGYAPKVADAGEEQKLSALAKAQEQTATVSRASGGEAPAKITARQLADMSRRELAKLSDEDFARVMGG